MPSTYAFTHSGLFWISLSRSILIRRCFWPCSQHDITLGSSIIYSTDLTFNLIICTTKLRLRKHRRIWMTLFLPHPSHSLVPLLARSRHPLTLASPTMSHSHALNPTIYRKRLLQLIPFWGAVIRPKNQKSSQNPSSIVARPRPRPQPVPP